MPVTEPPTCASVASTVPSRLDCTLSPV
jgi:hypothetical protein